MVWLSEDRNVTITVAVAVNFWLSPLCWFDHSGLLRLAVMATAAKIIHSKKDSESITLWVSNGVATNI
jgi:hypothetical protein